MLRTRHPAAKSDRRGIILLVVVIMLALFAVIGLSFVLYSESEANASRLYREAQSNRKGSPPDPLSIFNDAMGDIVYDVPDDETGMYNVVRGHSLARAMYGWKYEFSKYNGSDRWIINSRDNNVPYNGYGAFDNGQPLSTGKNHTDRINYAVFPSDNGTLGMLDPERLNPRAQNANPVSSAPDANYIGKNANYTYPDRNNLYLGAIRAMDGKVLQSSFHRPELFNYNDTNPATPYTQAFNNPAHPAWTSAMGKYRTLRPRPAEHTAAFPFPTDAGGDVKNVEGAPGGNDSIWVDHDLPVREWNGKLYKPLLAWFITDLDGRVNLNTASNRKNTPTGTAISHQGWGAWEVNPVHVMPRDANDPARLLTFNGSILGRYGTLGQPRSVLGTNVSDSGTSPHNYARVDYDSADAPTPIPGAQFVLPQANDNRLVPVFGSHYADGDAYERNDHPSVYNPYLLPDFAPPTLENWKNRVFSIAEMKNLNFKYAAGATDTTYATSELGKLMPNNFGVDIPTGTGFNPRYATTTLSSDLAFPGMRPFIPDFSNVNALTHTNGQPYPTGGPVPINPPAPPVPGPASPGTFGTPVDATVSSDVRGPKGAATLNDWRSTAAVCTIPGYEYIGAVNLNRKLKDYRIDPTQPFPTGPTAALDPATYKAAVKDRQDFALEIYKRLVIATGVNLNATYDSANPVGNTQWNAKRSMAQLAVNIVDYIDNDDYMTPFVAWTRLFPTRDTGPEPAVAPVTPDPLKYNTEVPAETVWGTEIPRLVLNEAYAEIRNDNSDNFPADPIDLKKRPAKDYRVNFWVELLNPSRMGDPASADGGAARLALPGVIDPVTNKPVAIYKVVITKPNANLRTLSNTRGNPDLDVDDGTTPIPATVLIDMKDYTPASMMPKTPSAVASPTTDTNMVLPLNDVYSVSPVSDNLNNGFYVLGPNDHPGDNGMPGSMETLRTTLRKDYIAANNSASVNNASNNTSMTYSIPKEMKDAAFMALPPRHDILLRRLAVPHMLPNLKASIPDPNDATKQIANPDYNPYITVDTMQNIETQDGVAYDQTGQHMAQVPVANREAFGKRSPYASMHTDLVNPLNNQIVKQSPATPTTNEPKNTFFRHNGISSTTPGTANDTLDTPFDWLVHLDRQLINVMELLHVSAYKPHELTLEFVKTTGGATPTRNAHRHVAPWLRNPQVGDTAAADIQAFYPDTRLFRALELMTTSPRTQYLGNLARVPGKININTVYDREVLKSLIDPQATNTFWQSGTYSDQAQADKNSLELLWNRILQTRSPSSTLLPGAIDVRLSDTDKPFRGFGERFSGDGTTTDHVGQTLMRTVQGNTSPTTAGNQSIFENLDPVLKHRYEQNEMLRKMLNNTTTRSNTFAVWCTIGYFEVVDYSGAGGRPRLGAEIADLPRNRFFAIVDRTNLTALPASSTGRTPGVPQPGENTRPGTKPLFFTIDSIDTATRIATIKIPISEFQVVGQPGPNTPTPPSVDLEASGTPGQIVNSVEGVYDGDSWEVNRSSAFYIMGQSNTTIAATVTGSIFVYGPPVGSPAKPMNRATFTVQLTADPNSIPNLSPGDSLTTVPLGNPGPQKDFNISSPVYSGVVPYAVQIR